MYKSGLIGGLILLIITLFVVLVPSKPNFLSYSIGAGSAIFIFIHFIVSTYSHKKRAGGTALWIALVSLSLLFIFLPAVFAAALYYWQGLSFLTWILLISLTIAFYYNFLSVPLAIYHRYREKNTNGTMRDVGFKKVLQGITTIEEVQRVTSVDV